MDQSRRKIVIISALVILVLIVIVIITAILVKPQKVKTGIKFVIVPDSVTVKTKDQSFKINYEQIRTFTPGEYKFIFSSPHFVDTEKSVTVKENEITPLYVLLKAGDETGDAILKEAKYQPRIERIGGFEVTAGAAELTSKYPFIDKLPITGKYYYIYPCVVNPDTKEYGACVKLALQGEFYRNQALDALRQKDIDPSTIPVQFQNPS